MKSRQLKLFRMPNQRPVRTVLPTPRRLGPSYDSGRTRCGQRFCGRPSPGSGFAHSSGTPWPSSPRCQPLSKEPPQVSRQRAPSAPVESRDVDPCGHLDPPPCGREGALPGAVARLPPAEIRAPRTTGSFTVTAPAGQSLRRPRLGFQLLGHALPRAAWPIGALERRRGRSRSELEFLRNVSGWG